MGRPLISSLCETWELRCYSRYKHQLVDEKETLKTRLGVESFQQQATLVTYSVVHCTGSKTLLTGKQKKEAGSTQEARGRCRARRTPASDAWQL